MYSEALAHLTCPRHPEQQLAIEQPITVDDEIVGGSLRCPICAACYPIKHGIADLLGPRALPDSLAQLTNYLPPTAWAYERTWRHRSLSLLSGEPFGTERELPLITRMVAPERGGLFIDVACSNGLYARSIEQARSAEPGHVLGIDHAMPMLRQARTFAQAQGLRISYVRAKAQALPFRSGSATGVTMGGSLNEIGDAPQALRELQRLLAPAGRCALMCLVQGATIPGRALQSLLGLGGVAFWPLDKLNRTFAAAGLQLVEQERYRIVVFSLLKP